MAPLPQLLPTKRDVALLLRTRTVGLLPQQGGLGADTGPQDITEFDEDSRPTATEVEEIIVTAYGAIESRIDVAPGVVPAQQEGGFRHAVALYAAILIEVSYFRETMNQALLDMLRLMLNEAIENLVVQPDGGDGTGELPGQVYTFTSLRIGSDREPVGAYGGAADFWTGIDDGPVPGEP